MDKEKRAKKIITHAQNPEMATFEEMADIAESLQVVADSFSKMHIEKIKGEKGDKGDKGDTGPQGSKGDTGEKGADSTVPGPKGDKGEQGESIIGEQGPQGERGEKGEQGEKGDKGDDGSPDTAFDIKKKLESLLKDERLSASAIQGWEDFTQNVQQRLSDRIIGGQQLAVGNYPEIEKLIFTGATVTVKGHTATIAITGGGGGGAVDSVFGRTGDVVAQSGDYTTALVTEDSGFLYFTNTRARAAISLTTTGTSGAATYDNTTGVLNIPNYSSGTGTVTTVSVVSANGFAGSVANASTTPAITLSTTITGLVKGNGTAISAASAGTDYQAPITLTTTGTSGAATFTSNTLNIPQYQAAGTYVTSVSGTTNRITSSGGTTPAIDIAATYVGQSSITTLGTITTGVWNGTAIANANLANSAVTVNGTSISLGASGTVTAAAGTLTGTTLNSTVVTSSLTSVGTIGTGIWQGTVVAGQYGGTGVANTGKTITLGGNFTTSGAFTTTLTVTANTSITLPTTGIVATLAGSEALTNKSVNGVTLVTGGSSTKYLSQDGTYTTPAGGGGGSPGGSDTQIQFNDAGSFGGDAGLLYDKTTTTLTTDKIVINKSGASSILEIDAHGSTTNLAKLTFTNSAGTGDFKIAGDGGDVQWQGGGSRQLQMGAYHGIILLGGRVTTSDIAFESGTSDLFNIMIRNTSAASINLILKGASGQSGNFTEWQDDSGTLLSAVLPDGSFRLIHLADASAANDSWYFSTTGSKPAYKDSGGTAHYLY